MHQKKIYIIPGKTEHCDQPHYQAVAKLFEQQGYQPSFVTITWDWRTMADYVQQFLAQVGDTKDAACFGFSFGAMIAVRATTRASFSELFLASLSPYFAEDLKNLPASWLKYNGKKRLQDFEHYSFTSLAKNLTMPVHLVVGEFEPQVISSRAQAIVKACPHADLTIIPKASHDLAQPTYQAGLHQWFKP